MAIDANMGQFVHRNTMSQIDQMRQMNQYDRVSTAAMAGVQQDELKLQKEKLGHSMWVAKQTKEMEYASDIFGKINNAKTTVA